MIETMIEMSDEITELAKALPKAQAAFLKVAKDATNPHFSNKYASLSEIMAAVRPALNEAGITLLQPPSAGAGAIQVTTILWHTSGQWFRATHTIPVSKADAQGFGSALTYARRQALQSTLGIAPEGEDDDGEGSVGRGAGRPPLPPSEPSRPTLASRAANLEKRLDEVKTLRDEEKAWDAGKALLDELREKEPQVAARLEALHQRRHAELIGGAG